MWDWLNWLIFDAGFLSLEQRYWIGLLVALGCFALASYFANEVKDNPRLFTVVALLAGALVAIASVYEAPQLYSSKDVSVFKLPDRASDLSSFILVFAGAVLAREGKDEHWFLNSQRLQVAAMSLLAALVIPRQFPAEWISPQRAELVLGQALGLVGFLALGLGAKAVAKPSHFAGLAIILVLYAVLGTGRTLELMIVTPRRPMSDFFMLSFALAKILMTWTFCYIVLWHHRLGPRRSQQPAAVAAAAIG